MEYLEFIFELICLLYMVIFWLIYNKEVSVNLKKENCVNGYFEFCNSFYHIHKVIKSYKL